MLKGNQDAESVIVFNEKCGEDYFGLAVDPHVIRGKPISFEI